MKHPLSVSQLTVNYDNTPSLWDISFEAPQGLIGLIGPNGAGKSTLIKATMGLVEPLSGKILFFGKPLAEVYQRIAYVPQRESVDWDYPITVRDVVMMGRYGHLGLLKWPRQADEEAVDHMLELVGMTPYTHRQISQLSGGQQQRVFLARALVQEADLYLMDEPFIGIDHATETFLINLLRTLAAKGKTVFVVHHDLNAVEKIFDWVVLLNVRLVAAGPTQEVFTADNLRAAYGTSYSLLDEAFKIALQKQHGV